MTGPQPQTAQLFITCLVDHLYPEIAEAVVTVLEREGVTVEVPPDQTCCGQPAFNGGFLAEARQMARYFLDIFAASEGPIVCPSGSCASMVAHHYTGLFAGEPDYLAKATAVAARLREFSQFLVEDLGLESAGGRPGLYTYHPTCHLTRDLGVHGCAETLLDHIPGAERLPLPEADACCGFGGLFAVKLPAVSSAMLHRKLENVSASGAETCVLCDASCMTQMNGGLIAAGKPPMVRHLAEVLAER
ncbi:MAG: (Fe-S)-binding protein [Caldilineales bacterium]|nr:(Fe-S)-binding protein [Caldilineales bacterium]MCW5860732.1 (Fe-S)-binding protein [Caldilineales bacterium]